MINARFCKELQSARVFATYKGKRKAEKKKENIFFFRRQAWEVRASCERYNKEEAKCAAGGVWVVDFIFRRVNRSSIRGQVRVLMVNKVT